MSVRAIARKYGVARSTTQDFVNANFAELKPVAPAIPAPGVGVTEHDILEAELRDLRRRVRATHKDDVEFERVLSVLRDTVEAAPVRYEPSEYDSRGGKPHEMALLLSDLHAGEIVSPQSINHMNSYDWQTCVDRMDHIRTSLLSYRDNRPYGIDTLHLWMLGDMVSGKGHAELRETNEFPPAEQAYRVGMLLGQWVESLIPEFPKINVYCVPGNHGRVPDKPASKMVHDSFDWIAYMIMDTYLTNHKEAILGDFEVSRGAELVVPIAGRQVLLFHGDGIRSTMPGVPWGGVTRRVNEKRKQYAQFGVQLGGFALGHFHQANAVSGPIWMNGSVKGADEYSLKNFGSSDAPEQLLVTWNTEKGRPTDVSYINP